jgi:hypothetical protein
MGVLLLVVGARPSGADARGKARAVPSAGRFPESCNINMLAVFAYYVSITVMAYETKYRDILPFIGNQPSVRPLVAVGWNQIPTGA